MGIPEQMESFSCGLFVAKHFGDKNNVETKSTN